MDPGYSIDVIFYPNVRAAWPKRAILAAARLATTTARQEGTPRGGLRLLCAQLEESLCGRLRCPQEATSIRQDPLQGADSASSPP